MHVVTSTQITPKTSYNVVADLKPKNPKKAGKIVLLGSHLDSVPEGPGINDNGSGSATDLEIAIQMEKNKPPRLRPHMHNPPTRRSRSDVGGLCTYALHKPPTASRPRRMGDLRMSPGTPCRRPRVRRRGRAPRPLSMSFVPERRRHTA